MSPRRASSRRLLPALAALVVATAGCTLQVTTSRASGTGEALLATPLTDAQVDLLGLGGVGEGAVSWWAYEDGPVPGDSLERLAPYAPADGFTSVEVLHPTVTAAPGQPERDRDRSAPAVPEVVVRPAWSTTVDNRSGTASTLTLDDEVTVSFATPGSPGQHPGDAGAGVVDITGEVAVPAGACTDLVSLQVWQLGGDEDDPRGLAVEAEYLGSVLVGMTCA